MVVTKEMPNYKYKPEITQWLYKKKSKDYYVLIHKDLRITKRKKIKLNVKVRNAKELELRAKFMWLARVYETYTNLAHIIWITDLL